MKNLIAEKNKLPLTFKYIDIIKIKNVGKLDSNTIYYIKCEKFNTEYFVKLKPYKNNTLIL